MHGETSYKYFNEEGEDVVNQFKVFDPGRAYGIATVQMDFEHGLNKPPPPAVL